MATNLSTYPTPAAPLRPALMATASTTAATATVRSDWKDALPVLQGAGFTLRALRVSDAAALLTLLTTEEVTRFISPPPTTVEGFERFIAWATQEQAAGRYVCFGIVPEGAETAVGLFQVRQLDGRFDTAEWGFAIGSAFWGSGLFTKGAHLVVDFAFEVLGVHRLEARAVVANGRGNGALRKIGAIQEGILRQAFLRGGVRHDQALWALLAEDWYRAKAVWGVKVH